LWRKHGFSDASFCAWRSEVGGMDVLDAKRLKALERENVRLKKLPRTAQRLIARASHSVWS
jgi:putative transposase